MHGKLIPPGERGRKSWYWRGTIHGKRHEHSLETTNRRVARERAPGLVAALEGGQLDATGPVTFRAAAVAYDAFRTPKTQDRVNIDRLVDHFGDTIANDIRRHNLVEAAKVLLPGRSHATWNRSVVTPAATILHYAADQGWCEYRRFRGFPVALRSNRKPATDGTMQALLANITPKPTHPGDKARQRAEVLAAQKRLLLATLYEVGPRITDTLRLGDDNLDLPAGLLTFDASKNNEEGRVSISPDLVAMMASTPRCAGGRLFPWSTRWSVYNWLRPLVRKLGLTYTPHMSRHAMASDLFAAGVESSRIRERGLWRDDRSPRRYIQKSDVAQTGRSVGALKR